MPAGVELVGYADDLLIVISRREIAELRRAAVEAVERVASWMGSVGLEIAADKTAAVWLSRRRAGRTPGEKIYLLGQEVEVGKKMRYLGVVIEANPLNSSQVAEAAAGAGKTATSIARLLANLGGPSEATRRLLMGAATARLLYAAPVWAGCTGSKRNRDRLGSALRPVCLRVARCYKTVSTAAAQVLASSPPPDLMVEMRGRVYSHVKEGWEKRAARREGQAWLLERWQGRWNNSTNGAWTKRLIPEVGPWVGRRHGEVDYFLGQILSGHGEFEAYLFRIGKARTEECPYCGDGADTAEHTLLFCSAWSEEREELRAGIGAVCADSLVAGMLARQESWRASAKFAEKVIRRKEHLKRDRANRNGMQ